MQSTQPQEEFPADPLAAVARSALRDPIAAETLMRALQPEILRLCGSLTDRDSAEDVAQESMLRILVALQGFRYETTVRIWALSITRRAAMDHLRRTVRRRKLLSLVRATHVEDPAQLASHAEVDELLSHLRPERRAAFVLTQLIGLSYEEAAEVSGCPVGTIRSRVSRARADLVALISPPASGAAETDQPDQ